MRLLILRKNRNFKFNKGKLNHDFNKNLCDYKLKHLGN